MFITGSQMGKSEALLNFAGQKLDDDPAPILYIGPTKSNIDRAIEPRIAQMLRSAATLWAKTKKGRLAQKLVKEVGGVTFSLAWAGSATELASRPSHTVLIDELDRMDAVAGEGDVVTLAEARMATYPDGRLLITSTPIEGNVDVERNEKTGIEHWKVADAKDLISPIWKLFQEGTRFEWAVPCPDCQRYFVPRFRLLWWPEKCTAQRAKNEARLICQRCGSQIEETAKASMNAAGRYLAPGQDVVDGIVTGDITESDTASFWASGIMSPWRSFGGCASKWIRAEKSGDQERIRAVINTDFGELYAFRGDALPAEEVKKCIGTYSTGEFPAGIKRITCGVDVQKRRLVYAVRGWGYGMESWLLDSGEFHGDTDQAAVWDDLADLLETPYGPSEMRIRRMGIDSGYRPGDKWRRPDNMIYAFCLTHKRALPTKGRDHLAKPLSPSLIDVTFRGQTHKKGLMLWHIDSDYFKSWLMARLSWESDKSGRFWVPRDVTDDYCQQLTAETRVVKPSGQSTWIRVRPDNHYLDCEAINIAMAQSLGWHKKRPRTATTPPDDAAAAAIDQVAEQQQPEVPKPVQQKQRSRMQNFPRSNWTTGWKP